METFVVRVFVPANDEKLELTGIVEHSGSGHSEHFQGTGGLVGVVLDQLELDRRPVEPLRKEGGEVK